MTITTDQIKELREATGAGILDCRKALEDSGGDMDQAIKYLREKGIAKAAKRADREASEGVVELYSHGVGRVGVMLELNCETDFVARSDGFRDLAHELALQIAAANPLWITEDEVPDSAKEEEAEIARKAAKEEGKPDDILDKIAEGRVKKYMDEVVLLRQKYIRDESKTVEDLMNETVAAIGENIKVRRFVRWELGELIRD